MLLAAGLILFSIQPGAAQSKYKNIDRYARFTPSDFENSVEMLARYLIDGAENDVEKVRAFYVWIAENISYDTKSYFRRQYPTQSPEAVLIRRTAICQGYANLFKRFCDIANIPCMEVSGFSKGYGTNPAIIPEQDNHIWNIVQVNEEWHLVDVSWASGYINNKRQFVKRFTGYYFFTDPAEFIFTHFPSNHNFQLLLISQSEEEFLEPMKVLPEWYDYGLESVNPKKSLLIRDEPLTVTIKKPDTVEIAVKLSRANSALPENYTFVQNRDSLSEITALFTADDIFTLKVFAKSKTDSGVFNYMGEYWIDVRDLRKSGGRFPTPFKTFYEQNCYLYNPLSAALTKGDKTIELAAPAALKVAIVKDKRWIYFENSGGGIFKGIVPAAEGGITVYGLFPGDTKFQALLEFPSQ